MCDNLLKIVTNLGSPKVLVAGDFMLDIYLYGDAERISPEAPVPVLWIRNKEYGCGGAGSVTADLVTLGAVPMCFGIIGEDENAKILLKKLKEIGADTTGLLTTKERPTTSKQRLIGLAQHRHQQQLFRMDEESTNPITETQSKKIIQLYKKYISKIDIVCLQDHNKGFLTKPLCMEMIKLAIAAGKKVIIDPCPHSDYSKYKGATLLTPNRQECSIATGVKLENQKDFDKAAKKLIKQLNLQAVVITLDKTGAYLKTKDTGEIVHTRPRNVYDVTGAGDMVMSMLAMALSANCDYKTAVMLANTAGGIEVEKFGNIPVTIEEITNEILSQKHTNTEKLLTIEMLIDQIKWHRRQKKTVVFTNGCFDVIHAGHIEYLKFCRSQGDIVVLGLNSDSSVKSIKGPQRPINNQADRASVLAALESIDYITIFDEPDPLNLIKKIKPDFLVKGQDWEHKGVIGREFVESYGGKVVLAKLVPGKSSTSTIEKLKLSRAKS
jgi:D-beta-D-heptose 7-phosphate kinase / D-beta-D-heptose 1-phosphate adenosyltransferase